MNTTERDGPEVSWRQLVLDLGYLLPGLPIAIVSFVSMLVGFVLGVGLFVLAFVGLAIMVATLAGARRLAQFERARVGWMEGRAVGPVYYLPPERTGLARLLDYLRDPQSWRDWGYCLLILPLRLLTWTLTIAWTALSLALAPLVLLAWAITGRSGLQGLPWVLAITVRGLAAVESSIAWLLLTNESAALRARTEALSRSRESAVQAEADTLRRVERDIHDGPQQRLVRLTMDLESAQRRIDEDPATALPLLEGAVLQTKEALAELRALSRGIAPPILNDRGLPAALAAAAARCPIPTTLDIELTDDERLSPSVENAAYFVVAEALTNAAKHSGAHQCTVSVAKVADRLHVQVIDDGRGGAHPGKGHGLAGLSDRLTGVDGRLDVSSPPGHGTTIDAQLPLPPSV